MERHKEETLSRRERKKKQTREALETTALKLFRKKGYDQTTIKEITETIDVSLRTFFRYFDSKEAVLFGNWRGELKAVHDLILSRPPDEPLLVTLYECARLLTELDRGSEQRLMLIRKLAKNSRRLGDYERNVIFPEFEGVVADAIGQRMHVDPASDPRPRIIAAVAVAAWTTARRIWMENDGKRPMSELIQEIISIIAPDGTVWKEAGT